MSIISEAIPRYESCSTTSARLTFPHAGSAFSKIPAKAGDRRRDSRAPLLGGCTQLTVENENHYQYQPSNPRGGNAYAVSIENPSGDPHRRGGGVGRCPGHACGFRPDLPHRAEGRRHHAAAPTGTGK